MGYIPSNPVVSLRALLDPRKLDFPPPGLFSTARRAILCYLNYLSEAGRRRPQAVLLPDYMCREVGLALREAGYSARFYPLDRSFDVSLKGLETAIQGAGGTCAVVAAHFYGRICRNIAEVEKLCGARGLPLIEDCVHLPFPAYCAPADFHSEARVFTLRKIYPVPFGAAIALKTGQEEFGRFAQAQGSMSRRGSGPEFLRWAAKQLAKKGLLASGLGYAAPYRDVSLDPSTPFHFAPPWLAGLLSMRNCEDAVALRRKNYLTYLEHARTFRRWGEILEFDVRTDAPYMFVLDLKEGLGAESLLRALALRGIPAAPGLALDPEVLRSLPEDHRYRRIVVFPVHQDIEERHIRRIAGALEELRPFT